MTPVDNRTADEYTTLDDPVCSLDDGGCGGSGYVGQSVCGKCKGAGRVKAAKTEVKTEGTDESSGDTRRRR